MGLGAGAALTGAVMFALTKPSSDVSGGVARAPGAVSGAPKARDAFLRQPTWTAPSIGAAGKIGLTLPLRLSF